MLGAHKDSFPGLFPRQNTFLMDSYQNKKECYPVTSTPRLGEESGSILVDFSGGLVLSELAFFSIEVEMVLMVWNRW